MSTISGGTEFLDLIQPAQSAGGFIDLLPDRPPVMTHEVAQFDVNRPGLLSRGAQQLLNALVLEDIEQARPSTTVARAVPVLDAGVRAMESEEVPDTGQFGIRGSIDDGDVIPWYRAPIALGKLWWAMTSTYYSDEGRELEGELRAQRGDVTLDVPPAEGFGEKFTDAVAGLTAMLARLVVLNRLAPAQIPASLRPAVLFEAENLSRGGIPGHGAVLAGSLGAIESIPLRGVAGTGGKIAAESTLFAGMTAAEGGDATDVMIAAMLPPGLRSVGLIRQMRQAPTPEAAVKLATSPEARAVAGRQPELDLTARSEPGRQVVREATARTEEPSPVEFNAREEAAKLKPDQRIEAIDELQQLLKQDKTAPPEQRMDAEDVANAQFVLAELKQAAKQERTPPVDQRQQFIEQARQQQIEGAEHPQLRGVRVTEAEAKAVGGLSEILDSMGVKVAKGEILFSDVATRDTLVKRLQELSTSKKAEISLTFPQRKAIGRLADRIAAAKNPTVEGRVEQAQTAPGKGPSVRQTMRALIFPQEGRTVTERQALRASLKRQRAAASQAFVAGKREAQGKAREELTALRVRLQEQARARTASAGAMRGELVRIIQKHLPQKLRGKLLAAVKNADTYGKLARGVRRVRTLLGEFERRSAITDLRATMERLNVGGMRPQFRAMVEKVVSGLQEKKPGKATVVNLKATAEFLRQNPDHVVPEAVQRQLERLTQKPMSELTIDEAVAIREALERIERQSDTFDRLSLERRDREERQAASEILEELTRPGSPLKPRHRLDSGRQQQDKGTRLRHLVFGREENMTLDTLADFIGGGERSAFHRVFYGDIAKGQRETMRGHLHALDELNVAITDAGLKLGSRKLAAMSTELAGVRNAIVSFLTGRGLRGGETKATVYEHQLESGKALKLTAAERMHLLSVLKDPETFDLIVFEQTPIALRGRPAGESFVLTLKDVRALEAAASPAEHVIIERLVAYVNGPVKQTVQKWSAEHLGYDITKRRVYFPRHRIRPTDADPEVRAPSLYQKAVEQAGLVQERTGGGLPIEVRDMFAEFSNHSLASYGVANLGPPLRLARQVLNNGTVAELITNSKRGMRLRNRLENAFDQLAREIVGGAHVRGPIEQGFRGVFNNIAAGLLGNNPGVALYQPLSLLAAANEMPLRHLVSATVRGAALNAKVDARMMRASPYLRARAEGSSMGLIFEGGQAGSSMAGFRARGDGAFWLIRAMDNLAIRVIFRGAELQAKAEGLKGKAAAARAGELAEQVVKRTQSTFDSLHSSATSIEAKQSLFAKSLTFFRSQSVKNLDLTARAIIDARRNPWKIPSATAKVANVLILQSLAMMVAMDFKDWALRGFEPPDDADRQRRRNAKRTIDVTFTNFIGGQYFSAVVGKALMPEDRAFEPNINPVSSLSEEVLIATQRLIVNAQAGGDADKLLDASLDLTQNMAALSGIPVAAPMRDVRKYLDNAQQQADGGTLIVR